MLCFFPFRIFQPVISFKRISFVDAVAIHVHHRRETSVFYQRKIMHRPACLPFGSLPHADIINHHPLVNRWHTITDHRQVSALQIYWLRKLKHAHTQNTRCLSTTIRNWSGFLVCKQLLSRGFLAGNHTSGCKARYSAYKSSLQHLNRSKIALGKYLGH